jgi:hypothetical protein
VKKEKNLLKGLEQYSCNQKKDGPRGIIADAFFAPKRGLTWLSLAKTKES